jgi:hypothetical protein
VQDAVAHQPRYRRASHGKGVVSGKAAPRIYIKSRVDPFAPRSNSRRDAIIEPTGLIILDGHPEDGEVLVILW